MLAIIGGYYKCQAQSAEKYSINPALIEWAKKVCDGEFKRLEILMDGTAVSTCKDGRKNIITSKEFLPYRKQVGTLDAHILRNN
jgi:hypothetical protein